MGSTCFNMFQHVSTCFSMFSLHCRLWIFRFRIIMASSLQQNLAPNIQQFSKLRFWRPCSAWECGDLYRLWGVMTFYTTMRMLPQWDSEMLLGPRCLWTLYILSDISFVSYHISFIVHPVFHPFFMGFTVFSWYFRQGFWLPPSPGSGSSSCLGQDVGRAPGAWHGGGEWWKNHL